MLTAFKGSFPAYKTTFDVVNRQGFVSDTSHESRVWEILLTDGRPALALRVDDCNYSTTTANSIRVSVCPENARIYGLIFPVHAVKSVGVSVIAHITWGWTKREERRTRAVLEFRVLWWVAASGFAICAADYGSEIVSYHVRCWPVNRMQRQQTTEVNRSSAAEKYLRQKLRRMVLLIDVFLGSRRIPT